jgi:threonine dehydrogenase-like Zn-dependent dehydrogenase
MNRPWLAVRTRGVSMLGILFICVAIVVGALKVIPSYLEFRNIQAAAVAARDGGKTVVDIQKAFDRAAQINDITTLSGKDLDIAKDAAGNVVVSFKYEKKIPLFYNVSLIIEYAGGSDNP